MASEFNPEEEERICRLIKRHGGEIVLNPTGEGEQVIIDFDDIMELVRAEPSVDALIAEIDELCPSHVNDEYGCTHSDTLIMYHACDIKAILDKYRSNK